MDNDSKKSAETLSHKNVMRLREMEGGSHTASESCVSNFGSSSNYQKTHASGPGSITSESIHSDASTALMLPIHQPAVPANTPATQSVLGESMTDHMASMNIHHATAALTRIESQETVGATDRAATPKPDSIHPETPPNEHVHEHSDWADLATEDLSRALSRTAQYARDMMKQETGRTAEDYYSEKVADAIKKGEFKFDPKYLAEDGE